MLAGAITRTVGQTCIRGGRGALKFWKKELGQPHARQLLNSERLAGEEEID